MTEPPKIKEILLPLMSFPVPTQHGAVEAAVQVAKNLRASISAIVLQMDIQSPIELYPVHESIPAADPSKSAAAAGGLFETFEVIAAGAGVQHDRTILPLRPAEIPGVVAQEAHLYDICVLTLKDTDGIGQVIAEQLIFGSGRPVLLLPDRGERGLSGALDNIAIAWDFSAPATRAVADAMPFLQRANRVRVVTVVDEKPIKRPISTADLAGYLRRRNVTATLEEKKAGGQAIGDVLHDYVAEHGIDLLVMGGYGHSRIRDFLLGGATKSVLTNPPTWTLISH